VAEPALDTWRPDASHCGFGKNDRQAALVTELDQRLGQRLAFQVKVIEGLGENSAGETRQYEEEETR
jgi:hypothetical protein